jgi:sugar phosphate isomerase/epimerase
LFLEIQRMRRHLQLSAMALYSVMIVAGEVQPGEVGRGKCFKGPTGVMLLSARIKEQGVIAVLDQARQWGFKYVEVADTGSLTPVEFKAELDKRGLVAVGKSFPYNRLRNDIQRVIEEAKALGVTAVGCNNISHKKPFDEPQCRAAAEVFNRAGKDLAEQGLRFYYHNHGFEFVTCGQGTLFDLLVAETDPQYVSFEMDVMWTVVPGQDPVRLLQKYPQRWVAMHLKDLKKGVPTGDLSGTTAKTNDVALGAGQVDWPALLQTAQQIGIRHYFIEDESPSFVEQVPQSLRFLESLTW